MWRARAYFNRARRGALVSEYGIMTGIVALVLIAGTASLTHALEDVFRESESRMQKDVATTYGLDKTDSEDADETGRPDAVDENGSSTDRTSLEGDNDGERFPGEDEPGAALEDATDAERGRDDQADGFRFLTVAGDIPLTGATRGVVARIEMRGASNIKVWPKPDGFTGTGLKLSSAGGNIVEVECKNPKKCSGTTFFTARVQSRDTGETITRSFAITLP